MELALVTKSEQVGVFDKHLKGSRVPSVSCLLGGGSQQKRGACHEWWMPLGLCLTNTEKGGIDDQEVNSPKVQKSPCHKVGDKTILELRGPIKKAYFIFTVRSSLFGHRMTRRSPPGRELQRGGLLPVQNRTVKMFDRSRIKHRII